MLAAVLGSPTGLLLGRYRVLQAAFGIDITAGYSTPLIALVPLLRLWFGLGFGVKTVIIFLLTFFPIVINSWAGVRAVPKTLVEVGTAFCASQSTIMRQIVLPAVLPYIMAGCGSASARRSSPWSSLNSSPPSPASAASS